MRECFPVPSYPFLMFVKYAPEVTIHSALVEDNYFLGQIPLIQKYYVSRDTS